MRNFNSPFLDVVLRVPTWSQSSFWKLLYKSSFVHLFHEGPIHISLPLCLFLLSPSEWVISFLMLSWNVTILEHLLGATRSYYSFGPCLCNSPEVEITLIYTKNVLKCILCAPCCTVCWLKFNEPASSMGFPNRHVGRALGLDLRYATTLLMTKQ